MAAAGFFSRSLDGHLPYVIHSFSKQKQSAERDITAKGVGCVMTGNPL